MKATILGLTNEAGEAVALPTYNLVPAPNKRLPKRTSGSVAITLDGAPFVAPLTTNKGWNTDAATVLEYLWIQRADGACFYLTGSYGESLSSWKGRSIVTAEGAAERKDPVRVTDKPLTEADRVAKFKVTYAARA